MERFYNTKIANVYKNLNQELERLGLETLVNPFERGSRDEI
ncbi:hypothetical protein [Vallitalea sp.]|nr:hypothetical protein [Vallitalea sp.]MCT4686613.1 hypothetical protein [Vallitalea sp.]